MSELDEDELRLLAEAEKPGPIVAEPPVVVDEPILDDHEVVQPAPVDRPTKRRDRTARRVDPEPHDEPVANAAGPPGPEPDNPTAPPVQMDYGDPWGQLPAQMRHYNDGRLAI